MNPHQSGAATVTVMAMLIESESKISFAHSQYDNLKYSFQIRPILKCLLRD